MTSLLKMIKERTLNEEFRSKKVDHETDFHSAWEKHINALKDSENTSGPREKKLLKQVSRTHLQLAQLHAALHYTKHGKPIFVTGDQFNEFIRAQKHPVVAKKVIS